MLHVDAQGNISRCWSWQSKKEFGYLGNVTEPSSIKLLKGARPCYSPVCYCQHPTARNAYYYSPFTALYRFDFPEFMQKIFSQQIRFKDSNNNPYPDWEEHCINEFIISLKSGLSRELQNEDIGIPVIRANNTYNGIVGGNDIKYWYKKDPKGANIDNYILDDGDILINFINSLPRMGETAIYTNFLNRPCIYTTNLLRLKLNNKLNYKYFFYYTKTSEYINYIKAITKPAVNQASFTTVDFKNLKLLLPCLEEQEKIAKVLSKMNELIEEKKALLSDWQQFKKGLLQQMFV